MDLWLVKDVTQVLTGVLGVIVTALALFAAFRSGALQSLKFGPLEMKAPAREREQVRALIQSVARPDAEPVPFETEQLAQYYGQVLAQSRTSFWFSLVFASLGFFVIIGAGFLYTSANTGATVAQFFAGLVTDAVAGLFFVQSRGAQKSMGEFFDKLRRDRSQAEARRLYDNINDPRAKDALMIQRNRSGLDWTRGVENIVGLGGQ
jgi:hypothetical protein